MEDNQNIDDVNDDEGAGDSSLDDMISQMYSQYGKLSAKGFPSVSSLSTTNDKVSCQDQPTNETAKLKQTSDPAPTNHEVGINTDKTTFTNDVTPQTEANNDPQASMSPDEPELFIQFLEKLLPSTNLPDEHKSTLLEMSKALGPQLAQLETLFDSTPDAEFEKMMNDADGMFKDEDMGAEFEELSESWIRSEMSEFFNSKNK